jgi:alpha-galactosidase
VIAKIKLENSGMFYLDEINWLNDEELPFTFTYDGQSSKELLEHWEHEVKKTENSNAIKYVHTWRDAKSGLQTIWNVDIFKDFQALDGKLSFENTGKKDSKVIEAVNVLCHNLAGDYEAHYSTGGSSGLPSDAFVPKTWKGKEKLSIGAANGLPSTAYLPFWLMSKPEQGFFYCIGWQGQWKADFESQENGIRISAGMENLYLSLKPGEKISQPTVLMGSYSGDYLAGHNAVRRILSEKYIPKLNGKKPLPPVSWNHWFTFSNNINDKNISEQITAVRDLGLEYFCVDAGWFMTDFWQVGDWRVNPAKFPNGLEPIAKVIKDNDMKMGLWFEPERVTEKAYDAFEHKEWLLPNPAPNLYRDDFGTPIKVWLLDLTIPEAQQWAVDMIGDYVKRLELKWIRYDFNYWPKETWLVESKKKSERLGMKEIRYVEGLYSVLDRLLKNHPDMVIEWCAGGGRRIDFEMIRRSHTFWKSDLTGVADQTRPHLTGGNLFIPANYLNSNLQMLDSEYDYLGQFGGALGFNHDFRADDSGQLCKTIEMIKKFKEIRPLLLEDYYPLFKYSSDLNNWDGWQFHDPRNNKGCLIVFRPGESPYVKTKIKLRGLNANETYHLKSTIGATLSEKIIGRELMSNFEIELKQPRSAVLIEYNSVN